MRYAAWSAGVAPGIVAPTGVDRPVPRWSSSSTRYCWSARFIQPLGGLVGRVASKPGPPWRNTRYGRSAPSGAATSRVKTVIDGPSGRGMVERHAVLALGEDGARDAIRDGHRRASYQRWWTSGRMCSSYTAPIVSIVGSSSAGRPAAAAFARACSGVFAPGIVVVMPGCMRIQRSASWASVAPSGTSGRELLDGREARLVVDARERLADVEALAVAVEGRWSSASNAVSGRSLPVSSPLASGTRAITPTSRRSASPRNRSAGRWRNVLNTIWTRGEVRVLERLQRLPRPSRR